LEEKLMRPAFNSTAPAVHAGYQDRNSPIPYLFSSIGLMFGLVAVALMILACSYRKSSSNSATDPEVQEKSANQVEMKAEMEPKIVVIMAGDDRPTYLANPVSCNCQSDEQV
jgi:heme/copper-type cytochrome/quinol oxidase subunit 2